MKKQNLPQQQQQDDPTQAKMKKKEVQRVETAVVSPYPALQRAYADPASITPKDTRILQRTIGNQAVRRLVIQRKMTVGPVGDKYEQEADAVAKQVVNQIHSPQTSSITPPAQRQEDEEDVQMKPLLQRQEEEEDVQMKPQLIQRNSADGFETDDTFESSLSRQRGSGNPLPATLRTNLEPKFGADFSGVRVHTNAESHQLNQSIQAKAFTTGRDIFFRDGAYAPGNRGGQELIAHELTHVVQQGSAKHTAQRTLAEVETELPDGKTTDRDIFFRDGAYASGNKGGQESSAPELTHVEQQGSAKRTVQRTLASIEAKLPAGKTIGQLEDYGRSYKFSPENMSFLRAYKVWSSLGRGASIGAQTAIFNKYIAAGSPQQVNLPGIMITDLTARQAAAVTAGVPDVTIFDGADEEITGLIRRDWMAGFRTWDGKPMKT